MSAALRDRLAAAFPGFVSAEEDLDPSGCIIPASSHLEFARFLKEECGFTLYVTVVASHWPGDEGEYLEVATTLRRPTRDSIAFWWRVRVPVGEAIPTLFPLFAGADWQEREQLDLLGAVFADHPDPRRLMLPEDWDGHPLRKAYAIDTPHAPWR